MTRPSMLPSVNSDHVGTRDYQAFAAQWLAYALPCRRFADTLADANARLGADVDRYSFTVVDLHHLLLAGFTGAPKFLRPDLDRTTVIELGGGGVISDRDYRVTDVPLRGFWSYYAELLGIEPEGAVR